jgi:SAM-dependent methyltransferase
MYLNPRPDISELNKIYPSEYIPCQFANYLPAIVNSARMRVQKEKVKAVKKLVEEGAVIFDVGCGDGIFLDCLRTLGRDNWKLTGIDISKNAIDQIRKKGFQGICGRFEELAGYDGYADVIVLNQVIEHLEDPLGVAAKASDMLKKGGFIFIETPSIEGWDSKLFRKRYWGGWHFPRHWSFFSSKTINLLLSKSGFRLVRQEWLLSPNFWAQSIHHFLSEKKGFSLLEKQFDCSNFLTMAFFSAVDTVQKMFGKTSNMRVIGQKI